jgi:hypothetical protein
MGLAKGPPQEGLFLCPEADGVSLAPFSLGLSFSTPDRQLDLAGQPKQRWAGFGCGQATAKSQAVKQREDAVGLVR